LVRAEKVQKSALLIVLATLAVAAGVLYYSSQHPFTPSQQAESVSGINCTSYADAFTVVASQSGYNDSIAHGAPSKPWPVLCAKAGTEITITIVITDSVEPHGFAVAGYLDAGVTVLPGKTETISFYAGSPGDYKVYCNVICAVHPYMQSGVLVLSA
jgi:heme/copper-type cytochrome/quinol oxidase subunit 2